jgi:hypothetical protein
LTTPADLRERFARGRFIEQALERNYPCCVKYRRLRTLATEPRDVQSPTRRFVDPQGTVIVVLHCFLRPNGHLGASGPFDPKYLLDDDGTADRAP